MPERTFDVGISEGHAVTFAGGLAAAGKRPFVAIYSSFLQRAYDNIIHDVAIQGLPVTFCIDRAGLVGEDGVTHHGFFDLAYLNCIPGLKIAVPSDAETLRNLMHTSITLDSPMAIRYPRGKSSKYDSSKPPIILIPGKSRLVKEGRNAGVGILALGPVINNAVKASESLLEDGIETDIYDMIWMKPLDKHLIKELTSKYHTLVTIEDGIISGGFGSAVNDYIKNLDKKPKIINLGIPDQWILHGDLANLHSICGYDADGIAKAIKESQQ